MNTIIALSAIVAVAHAGSPMCSGATFAFDEAANADIANAPNSVAARDAFISSLHQSASNGFEALTDCGTNGCNDGDTLAFGALTTATISSTFGDRPTRVWGEFRSDGNVPIVGDKAFFTNGGSLTLTFSNGGVEAIGAYLMDLNEGNTIDITCASGATETVTVPGCRANGRCADDTIAFWSKTFAGDPCVQVTIASVGTANDGTMIDEIVVGRCTPPEPPIISQECPAAQFVTALDEGARGLLADAPNVQQARADFVNSFTVTAADGFEALPTCSTPGCSDGGVLTFGSLATATISSTVNRPDSRNYVTSEIINQYRAVSGTNGYGLNRGSVKFTFSRPVPAWSMTLNDVFEASATLTITCADGTTETMQAFDKECDGDNCASGAMYHVASIKDTTEPDTWCVSVELNYETPTGTTETVMIDDLVIGQCCELYEIDCGCSGSPPPVRSGNECVSLAFVDPADEDNLQCEPRRLLQR